MKMLFESQQYTNRELREVLPDGAWQGKPCFIIGGGPSLKDFDFSKLKGYRTIGINLAFAKITPTISFSMDTRFLRWVMDGRYGSEVKTKFERMKTYRVWLLTYKASLPDYMYIVKVYRNYKQGFKAFPFSQAEGIGHGNNSGYAALNLACCLGANPIYLLGYDMRHNNGKTHWHQGHPVPQKESTVKSFINYFNNAAPIIKKRGIRVINLNPKSALKCFEKKKPEEVLK